MKIAILGATGHIGSSLAVELRKRADVTLALFSRRPNALLQAMVDDPMDTVTWRAISDLDLSGCDVVINAIGVGAPDKVAAAGTDILRLTFEWEERIKAALLDAPECLYVFLSSGAIYGQLDESSASFGSVAAFSVNRIEEQTAYARAKFVAEAWHRTWHHNRILDVRVFGYVSRLIDLEASFFLSQIYKALREDTVFLTQPHDIIRDYVGPEEMISLIDNVVDRAQLNDAVDLYSLEPTSKFAIIDAMRKLGLRTEIVGGANCANPATRLNYCSSFARAKDYGYQPQRSSLDVVKATATAILSQRT